MIVRPPGGLWGPENELRDLVCDELTSLADILPTCLNIAEVAKPEKCNPDGKDLMEVLENKIEQRKDFYARSMEFHAIIDKQYKYLYCGNGGSELLFDVKNDPNETVNQLDNPEFAEILKTRRAAMVAKLKEQGETSFEGDVPISKAIPKTEKELHRCIMPGCITKDHPCDVLH